MGDKKLYATTPAAKLLMLTDVKKAQGAANSPEALESLAYYHRSPVQSTRDIFQVSGMSVKKDFSQEIVYFNNLLQTYKRNREPATYYPADSRRFLKYVRSTIRASKASPTPAAPTWSRGGRNWRRGKWRYRRAA